MIKNIEELDNYLMELNSFIAKEEGKRENLLEQIEESNKAVEDIKKNLDLMEKVGVLLQSTSEFARNQAKVQTENLVTNCLQFIFENNIEFEIEIEELYGKPNAEFYVITKSDDIIVKTKPELARGGGIVDIISLALRIAFLQIHKPQIEGPLILDEPAKHVSEDYIFNVADFLKKASEMFERQIIMVTHNDHLASIGTTAYKVSMRGTESYMEKITP